MRFVRKGGVWKNTEDEILKAAVMKYGKNQWARVSSLLVRKSAKQCKARWYEWLDPSVKKTEWSREEQEKLLHLAKIMPSQWRSIAAIVGRTPSQCLEHYARLLDAAQAQEELGAGAAAGAVSAREDLRKLRPGEIDPHPETKPARPDPVDMDEDEKEMLSEARARLANTKGKKAKRKAREKQLEEARRLATLQKRRELKAAGIEYRGPRQGLTKRKRKEIDYNAEIPFEARAPKGFFDTTQEDDEARRRRSEQKFIGKTLTEIEGRRRDDIEAEERKKDAKRQKLLRKHDLPSYVARISALNDPQLKKTRSKMQLPSPQISDADLRQLASATGVAAASPAVAAAGLEPNTPSTMGMRTPRVPESADRLVVEAQNLIALQSSDTPLVGGDNAPLRQSDFQGATPSLHSVVATPNILKQKQQRHHQQQTPVRDELNINTGSHAGFDDDDEDDERTSAAYLRQRQRESRERLRDGLLQLPRPKGDYELALPAPEEDEEHEHDEAQTDFVPDAADVRSWKQQQRLDEEEAAFRRLSSALQRPELPRPKPLPPKDVGRDGVEALVYDELQKLVRHDAKQPLEAALDSFSDAQMASARSLVDAELEAMAPLAPFDAAAELAAFEGAFDEFRFLPSRSGVGRWSQASPSERKSALAQELALRDAELSREVKRAAKAERKYEVLCGGYERRQRELAAQVVQAVKDVERAHIDLACFETLREREAEAVPARIRRLQEELNDVKQIEQKLHNSYRELELQAATTSA